MNTTCKTSTELSESGVMTFVLSSDDRVSYYCEHAGHELKNGRYVSLSRNGRLRFSLSEVEESVPALLEALRDEPIGHRNDVVLYRDGVDIRTVRLSARRLNSVPRPAMSDARRSIDVSLEIALAGHSDLAADTLARAHALTPVETALCVMLHANATLCMAAKAANVTQNTIKDRLKRVFEKTNTHRQAELIALLGRYTYH